MLTFISCQRIGILNKTGAAQYLPAGCSVQPAPIGGLYPGVQGGSWDPGQTPTNVPNGAFLVIPAGAQISLPLADAWFTSSPEWQQALAAGNTNFYDRTIAPPVFFPSSAIQTGNDVQYWPTIAVLADS